MDSIIRLRNPRSLDALALVAAVALPGASPVHAAATNATCRATGTATVCQSPSNAQLTTTQPPVEYHPYGNLNGPPLGGN